MSRVRTPWSELKCLGIQGLSLHILLLLCWDSHSRSTCPGRHNRATRNRVSYTEGGSARGGLVLIGPESPKFSGQRGCKKKIIIQEIKSRVLKNHFLKISIYMQLLMLVLNKAKHSRKLWILRHFSWKTKLSFHGWFFSVPEKTMKCATTLLHFPLLQKTQRRTFRCFTNHAREYSPTTESKPQKATSDQNIFVAIIYYAKRKPDLN